MPISHKIRQYRALLGFAHPGEILRSAEQDQRSRTKQGIWQGFIHQILIGSPQELGIGLLEQSAVHDWWFDRIRGGLRLPGGYPRPS